MCAFKVETLIEALQICNAYSDVCTGFVLTRDMNIRLKHQVRRLSYDNQAVTFVKTAFLSRIGHSVAQTPELYGRMRPSKSWTTIQCAPPYLKQFHVKKPFLIVHKVTVVEGTPYYNPSWHRGQKQDKNRPVEVSAEFNNMMAESLAHHSVKPQGRSLSLFQIVWLECLQTRLGWLDALPLCKTNTFSTLFYL